MIFRRELRVDIKTKKLAKMLVSNNLERIAYAIEERVIETLEQKHISDSINSMVSLWLTIKHPVEEWELKVELDFVFSPKKLQEERVLSLEVFACNYQVHYHGFVLSPYFCEEDGYFDITEHQQLNHAFTVALKKKQLKSLLKRELKWNNCKLNRIIIKESYYEMY